MGLLMAITFKLNGKDVSVDLSPETPLLYVLRNDLGVNACKFGCGLGQCGACSVLMDGASIRTCIMPVIVAQGKNITTLDGLGNKENPHPIQQAFIDEQAMQCGYCANGIMITATALLEKNPDPTDKEIRNALDSHLCRCGAHTRMIRAVKKAANVISKRTA